MNIIAVDDEKIALARLCECIQEADPHANLYPVSSPQSALDYSKDHQVDVAFLDINMRGINGIDLAKQLRAYHPSLNIIFVTGYQEYGVEAFSVLASGYVMKPFLTEDIQEELTHLRFPVTEKPARKGIEVRCFGNFSVYWDGNPISFKYTKTKEFFAYLVDRKGALCTKDEIMAVLFEDDVKSDYYQKLRADLTKTLPEDLFFLRRGSIGIRCDKISCDYYDYLNGTLSAQNAYNGEYMSQYSWAEETLANI